MKVEQKSAAHRADDAVGVARETRQSRRGKSQPYVARGRRGTDRFDLAPKHLDSVPFELPRTSAALAPPTLATPRPLSTRIFPPGFAETALWLWDGIATAPRSGRALVATTIATGANTLYLNAYPLTGRNRDWLCETAQLAAEASIELRFLLGEPSWTDPGKREQLERLIIRPLQALATETKGTRTGPATIHLDVEPHVNGPMTEDEMRRFVTMLAWFRARLGSGFRVEVDVPIWYGSLSLDGASFAAAIMQQADAVTLMAYERGSTQILVEAKPWLGLAAACGKQVVFAVEADDVSSCRDTPVRREFVTLLQEVADSIGDDPVVRGFAVHRTPGLKAKLSRR